MRIQKILFVSFEEPDPDFLLHPSENNGCVFRDKISDEDSNVYTDHPDR
ncbi:hypothetical protein KSF_089820 [Reticulibacter mediterranei]|uniref:Uncharacterized protein n=1 Tax=Reticulibacter mediterranei TaxID=2778369 RepID=A0A8J3N5C4_9CHLR|nr:hypothetical protein KSF_089820 [Reticulibacter mediterranei]